MPLGSAQRRSEAFEPSSALADADASLSTGLVLVVDDSYATRNAVAEVLRESGYIVDEAGSLRDVEGWCRTIKAAPQLAVVDFVLHDGKGDQVAACLHERWPSLFILYFSGSPVDGNPALHAARCRPNCALLAKPTHLDAIVDAVRLYAPHERSLWASPALRLDAGDPSR